MFGYGFKHILAGKTKKLGFDDERLYLTGEQIAPGSLRRSG
jgi:hypothetical protein